MRNLRRYMQEESGTALLASVLLVVLLTGAGMAAVMTTSVNQDRSKNVLTSKQAFYLADAGIQHAKTFLNQNQSNWNTYATTQVQTLLPYTALGQTGGYSVTVKGGGNGSLLLTSTGTAAGTATAVVQSLMTNTPSYIPAKYAFLTGKNLLVSANDSIQGTGGGVHANGNLTIMNSPTIAADATASGTYTNAGTPSIGGTSGGSKPLEPIPAISPADNQTHFYASRDYLLDCDGKVYDVNGVLQATSSWNGWSYSGTCSAATWTMNSSSTINGTLYVNGDVVITGAVGTTTTPWIVSIIAVKSINVSSLNIVARPPASTDGALYKAATQNILFLAGGDIFIHPQSGGTATFTGFLLAYEQIGVNGTSTLTINGTLLAADQATVCTVITANPYITGNTTTNAPKINYAGNLVNAMLGTSGGVQVMTWQATQY
jgi:Tfp pilus assembly protein PilX